MVGGSARHPDRDEEYGDAGWGGTGGVGREGENDGPACSVRLDAVNVGFACGAADGALDAAGRDSSVLPGPATVTPGSAVSPSGWRAGITVSAGELASPAPLSIQVTSLRDGPGSSGIASSEVATDDPAEAAASAGAAPLGAASSAALDLVRDGSRAWRGGPDTR